MKVTKEDYKSYAEDIENFVKSIDLKESTNQRTKVSKLVFSKAAWQESLTWFAIIQTAVIFMGLMDRVINNINSILSDFSHLIGLSNPITLPVNITSYIAFTFIIFLFCFGFIGYRYLRLPQTTQMIGAKNNGAFFLLWKQNQELNQKLQFIESKINKMEREK